MSFFTAYTDISGKDKDYFIVSGATISTDIQWLELEEKWKRVLEPLGIKIFHAADCASSKGEFTGWDYEKRFLTYSKLTKIMIKHIKFVIVHIVSSEDYLKLTSKEHEDILRTPTPCGYCQGNCAKDLIEWNKKTGGKLAIISELGDKLRSDFIVALKRATEDENLREKYGIYHLGEGLKKDFVPLQTSDFLAYEWFRFFTDYKKYKSLDMRVPLKVLRGKIPMQVRSVNNSITRKVLQLPTVHELDVFLKRK